jgi:hypothetical protein
MNGHFIGLTSNNAAICNSSTNATLSSYFTFQDSQGIPNSEHQVQPFLSFFSGEGDTKTHLLKFWCFSGIVETHIDQNGNHCGVCYYEARYLQKGAIDDGVYLYTGIASVAWNRKLLFLKAQREKFPNGPEFFSVSGDEKCLKKY